MDRANGDAGFNFKEVIRATARPVNDLDNNSNGGRERGLQSRMLCCSVVGTNKHTTPRQIGSSWA